MFQFLEDVSSLIQETSSVLTNTAFPTKLAGLHSCFFFVFFFNSGQPAKNYLLTLFLQQLRQSVFDFYLKHHVVGHLCHVSHHECDGNCCNTREYNNRPIAKEVSVKWLIHFF